MDAQSTDPASYNDVDDTGPAIPDYDEDPEEVFQGPDVNMMIMRILRKKIMMVNMRTMKEMITMSKWQAARRPRLTV